MDGSQNQSVSSFKSFQTFTALLVRYLYILRGLLGAQLALVVGCGLLFAQLEDRELWDGVYFAIISATTVGYGDISPATFPGQLISIFLALLGTIFFGNLVAVSTHAFSMTIKQDSHVREMGRGRER